MSTHTPGPWAQNVARIESEREHGWANDGWIIAKCEGPDAAANARLIAEAPALKERLESAIDALDRLTDRIDGTGFAHSDEFRSALDEIDLARAAIAKAEGEK
jgi:hypothetical protein